MGTCSSLFLGAPNCNTLVDWAISMLVDAFLWLPRLLGVLGIMVYLRGTCMCSSKCGFVSRRKRRALQCKHDSALAALPVVRHASHMSSGKFG